LPVNEVLSVAIFAVTLIFLLFEKWHRVVVSALGASAMVGAGHLFQFYDEEIAIDAVEFETLGLLLGMMMIVALLQETGFFSYIAIRVAQMSGGSTARLLLALGLTTSILSMFLDNVTTVILMAPVVILIAELLDVSPIPLLISQAIFSNTGGMATKVGDPPNILIGAASDLSFTDFMIHMSPIVLVVWIVSWLSMRLVFGNRLVEVGPKGQETLHRLDPDEALTDRVSARRILIVLGGVVIAFFLESMLGVTPAYTAMTGAGIAFLWTEQDIHGILREVEWDVLLFFSALFIMVGGLEASGVLDKAAEELIQLQDLSPVLLGLLIMWMMVVLSALVDNVPITIAVIPIVLHLGREGIDIQPIWWAIALGAGVGGNATPIGSTVNVVVISVSERTESPITTREWLRDSLPTVGVGVLAASVMYFMLYDFLSAG
jgi:Na+/H+ antiporter NhaD/arsenite permease-like protein